MLDLAGILLGNVRGDAKVGQIAGQQDMALIDFVGNLPALVGQMDEAVSLDCDIAVLPQAFHGRGHAGLGETQFGGNIDRANRAVSDRQPQDGF